MITLNHKVEVYIPSTVNVNQKINNSQYVVKCLKYLSGRFGGATAIKANGAWIAEGDELVMEDVTICYSYCSDDQLKQNKDNVLDYGRSVKVEMSQECVSVVIDGVLHLV